MVISKTSKVGKVSGGRVTIQSSEADAAPNNNSETMDSTVDDVSGGEVNIQPKVSSNSNATPNAKEMQRGCSSFLVKCKQNTKRMQMGFCMKF